MHIEDLRIAVVGSVNLDLVTSVARFPVPGETLSDALLQRMPGGKGANQALAARRLGAQVHLLACVGEDLLADEALAGVKAAGVDLSRCRRLPGVATGVAIILVNSEGENQIVVAPGANAAFKPELLDLPEAEAVICQLEVPVATLLEVARRHSGFLCLNAAPVRPVPAELLARVDLLVVNEGEAQALGERLRGYRGLLARTLGAAGAELSRGGQVLARATPPRVKVTDTTGAGDAFTAALVVGIVGGMSHAAALQRACVAGALTTTRKGAQSSPTAAELDALRELWGQSKGSESNG